MSNPLNQPVGLLAARVEPVYPEDSLQSVARELAVQGVPAMPVVRGHELVGVVDEDSIVRALASGTDKNAEVARILIPDPPTLPMSASGAEALRVFEGSRVSWILVVDARLEPVGVLTPSRLFLHSLSREFKGRIGGMATPFGVYLTNGVVTAGASGWALVMTGALMALVFHVAGTIVLLVQNSLPPQVASTDWAFYGAQISWIALFFLGIRLAPLSGTHGAEHMVVHAIERGEELVPDVVSRMPRVHPRCGTNLAVAAMLFLGIMSFETIPDAEMRLLLATLVTLVLWQPLGSMLQFFVTTKPPTADQLQNGIEAGRQFLARVSSARYARPGLVLRLAMSGLFQVLLGGIVVALLFAVAYEVLKVPLQWRVS